jgi:hypothetical protein
MMLFFCAGVMWVLWIVQDKEWPGFHQVLIDPKTMMHKLIESLKCSKVLAPDKGRAKMETQM